MITQNKILEYMDKLYPSRNSNILKGGRTSAIEIIETLMAQGFMDCLKFITEQTQNDKKQNINEQ